MTESAGSDEIPEPPAAAPAPPTPPPVAPGIARLVTSETEEMKYKRHTRNALAWIAAFLGVLTTVVVIWSIYIAAQISHANQMNGGFPAPASTCQSVGGTDPSC